MRPWLGLVALAACGSTSEPVAPAPQHIKVAVIGGMMETGFWPALVARFQQRTGHTVELAATGPKPVVIAAYRKGGIDLITVHASDAMVNLVADGLAVDPQPWLRNDLVIVGPTDDPAHVKGLDAEAALRAIAAAKAPLLVHASQGADGVLHDLKEDAHVALDPAVLHYFDGEDQHTVLARAAALHAYTLVGRLPVITGKLHADGMAILVQGDPRLRRPYLVETAPHAPQAAREFAAFLRARDTQAWIATFGAGKFDDRPLFYPVTVP